MSDVPMSLIDHLSDLRKVIIRIILAILFGAIISFVLFDDFLWEIIYRPIDGKDIELIQITVTEAFLTRLKVSFLAGAIITIPFTAWQLWSFILPALYAHEKKYVYMITPFSAILFVLGIIFGYFVVLPIAIVFFVGQGESLTPMLSFAQYVSFILRFLLPFGLVFQLPLAVIFLVRIGAVDHTFFRKNRKYAILLTFVVAAVLTPPDVISQVLMALPVLLLYEISIILSWLMRKKEEPEGEEEDGS